MARFYQYPAPGPAENKMAKPVDETKANAADPKPRKAKRKETGGK